MCVCIYIYIYTDDYKGTLPESWNWARGNLLEGFRNHMEPAAKWLKFSPPECRPA